MAKKLEDEIKEITTPKTVTVEMTEAEKEQFIKYKIELDKIEKPVEQEKSAVTLQFEHIVNNEPYGPGEVIVGKGLATYLFAQDEKKWRSNIAVTQENKKVVEMFMGGQRARIREGVI